MKTYVKLGPKANFFRCAAFNISLAPGEVVGLDAKQLNYGQIRNALNGGHLVKTEAPSEAPGEEDKAKRTPEELKEAFLKLRESGEDSKKIIKAFSMEELTTIASLFDIEVEDGDKKSDVYNAIVDTLDNPE